MDYEKYPKKILPKMNSLKMMPMFQASPTENHSLQNFRPGKYLMSVQSPSMHKTFHDKPGLLKDGLVPRAVTNDKQRVPTSSSPPLNSISRGNPTVKNHSMDMFEFDKQLHAHDTNNVRQSQNMTSPTNDQLISNPEPSQRGRREREGDELHQRIAELERELSATRNQANKSMMNLDFDAQASINFSVLEREEPYKLKQILISLILRSFESYKLLNLRCNKISNLSNLLEQATHNNGIQDTDLSKIRLTLEDLTGTLLTASKTEIDMGIKSRDLEKKSIELVKLKVHFDKLHERCDYFEKQAVELQKMKHDLQEKLALNMRQLEQEKVRNSECEKKISMLEKRIELILECDIAVDKDKLRKAITELVKENEGLKRNTFLKGKEIKRQRDELSKASSRMTRQSKKIESLLKQKKGPVSSGGPEESDKIAFNDEGKQDETYNLLGQEVLPYTLDFRTNSLRMQYTELLHDIMEQGASVFLSQLGNLDKDKKEAINFVTSQLVSSRDFADKLHFFIRETLELVKVKDISDMMAFLNKYFKHPFNSEHLNLWLADGITGIFYTYNSQKQQIRCLCSKGIISEVIKSGKSINKRNMKNSYICEYTTSNEKYIVESTLIFPIKNHQDKTYGMLEISNIADSHFGYDEEYFGLALSKIINTLLLRLNTENSLNTEQKYRSMMFDAFFHFCKAKSKQELCLSVKEWTGRIFGISTGVGFLLVEQSSLVDYTSSEKGKSYDKTMGICGSVVRTGRPQIVTDTRSSSEHNKLVDLSSMMPVYFTPVTRRKEGKEEEGVDVIGVLQIVIKPKNSKNSEELIGNIDSVVNEIGLDEPTHNLARNLAEFVGISIRVFETANGSARPKTK